MLLDQADATRTSVSSSCTPAAALVVFMQTQEELSSHEGQADDGPQRQAASVLPVPLPPASFRPLHHFPVAGHPRTDLQLLSLELLPAVLPFAETETE
jgi:hypothetical protein